MAFNNLSSAQMGIILNTSYGFSLSERFDILSQLIPIL